MCGILGGNNIGWNYKKGIQSMRHRGPDGIRIEALDDFTLAFARLAIIDLSLNGMQPMFAANKQVGIVFNGEIYDYQTLRKQLQDKGYKFKSLSDTEVILNAYLEWGEKFINKVDGMFGIAIYDKRDGTIKLYRDRVGIKPLYYYYDGSNFGFASELKGIVAMCDNITLRIDNTAIYDYLNYLYIPEPKTLYRNIYKVLPGHRLIFDIKRKKILKDNSYWKLKINVQQGKQRNQDDLIAELRALVKKSVSEQLIADVPVGTFLSGGIDSSIVTYESNLIHKNIKSFSIGFTKDEYNELKYVNMLIRKHGIKNEQKFFTNAIYKEVYHNMKKWYDEPFADTSAFPTHFVSELARREVTVVLTGDGGDEVFGGYERYLNMQKKDECGKFDNYLISSIFLRLNRESDNEYIWLDDLNYYLRQVVVGRLKTSDAELRKRYGIDKDYDKLWALRKYYRKDLPPITRAQFLDLKSYLPGDILTKVDRASMDVSLEARVPLLSRRIVEFAFSLSEEDRCPMREPKGLLKKAYEKELGKTLLYRPKGGFCMPRQFMDTRYSKQEELLEKVWKM